MNDNHIADDNAVTRGPNDAAIAPRADADTAGASDEQLDKLFFWMCTNYKTEGLSGFKAKARDLFAAGASNEHADAAPNPSDKQEPVGVVKYGSLNPLQTPQWRFEPLVYWEEIGESALLYTASVPPNYQAMRTALERIANMTDRDGNAIEMHREELRGIAKSAILAAKEKKS
jgi:hypothetical protein